MLLSFGHATWVAPLSNAFSALCAGITVGILFSTLKKLGTRLLGAWVGALCYLFCDTAWFSAVESEVYAMAMLVCSLNFYLAVCYRYSGNSRLIPLMGLTTGLGVGVHLMTLLALPAMVVVVVAGTHRKYRIHWLLFAIFFFMLGLSTYAIVPIRAAAHPSINELGNDIGSYLKREQYEKAPLYPRMWRERDSVNWTEWNAGRTDLLGNIAYGATYQVGYMYLRYIMYNFIGRENLKTHHIVVFVLPLLLGLWGVWQHFRRKRHEAWAIMLLFLFGGLLLNLYLNHPCYEPRERDYAYVLSFYAFALWIGIGTDCLPWRNWKWIALLAPLSMAVGNWGDHDRHRCHSVHDIAMNHLESCDKNALLITLGDNDTFPLWYLQEVEGIRKDVCVMNVGLTGWQNILDTLSDNAFRRPVYITHYFYQRHAQLFGDRLRCEGYCWQVLSGSTSSDRPVHIHDAVEWHITHDEYIDPISNSFLNIWQENTGQNPTQMHL